MNGTRARGSQGATAGRAAAGLERHGPVLAPPAARLSEQRTVVRQPHRWSYTLWILGLVVLFCLHFPHLLADFPNHSPWMDYSKYTDEGWYGNAATRLALTGHWYLHGDFNPAVALPVWPLLLAGVFHFTGVSLGADRSLALAFFGLDLLLAYGVVRTRAERWVALLAVTLLATSPFLWAFSRLAILESPLMFFLLLSWLLALRLPGVPAGRRTPQLIGIGLLLCLMILTKTTAIFLIPSSLFLVARAWTRRREAVRALVICGAAAALPWCAWYFLAVRPHYRVDYRYFFEANHWPQPTTLTGWAGSFWWALHGCLWISPALCIVAIAVLLLALFRQKGPALVVVGSRLPAGLYANPLTHAGLLAIAGYVAFIGWHNSPQPRYYEVVIYPVCFLLSLGIADLLSRRRHALLRIGGGIALAATLAVAAGGTIHIAGYLRHPEYGFLNAARGIARYVDAHPGPHRLLLSVSGDNIELMTGMAAICDDYGTWDLPYRIRRYEPGWYAAWNDIDPGTLGDIQSVDSLQPVASFAAFDDPDRNLLVLYRMHPLPAAQQTYFVAGEARDNAGR
jgi:4-amino-4-deoxy-L-arabinose transferase-like glycosyltransferase